jgi:hypothetical protein
VEATLRRIADMLDAFVAALAAWFARVAVWAETLPGITWGLIGALVVLSWLLVWRRRTPRALDVRPPQLLVTSGEVVPDGADDVEPRSSGRRRRRADPEVHAASGAFAMTVSNLSRYPVQLLEVALRDGRRGAPRVATVDAVVPAMGSVSVTGRLPLGLRGDGWLDLYCYAAAPRVKMHRHRVELVWEPWAARFKAAPLDQVSVPARRLASDEPDARFLEDDAPEPMASADPVAVARPPRPVEHRPVDHRPVELQPADHRPVERGSAAHAIPEHPVPIARRPSPAPVPERTVPSGPAQEPLGVPRIATPPVGVAVAGRGGASARTPDGLPIGRPTVRPERVPPTDPVGAPVEAPVRVPIREVDRLPDRDATREAIHAATPAPASGPGPRPAPVPAGAAPAARASVRPASDAPTPEAGGDAPPPEPPTRRRPRLEFPDEF